MVESYVDEHYSADEVARERRVDEITKTISMDLLPAVWTKLLDTFADNLLSGFVTTVAKVHRVLIWYSVLVYLLYIALLVYLGRHHRTSPAFLFGVMTMISICLNVGLVSKVIFCQTRYTIYNMPLFYMSLLYMLREAYRGLPMKDKYDTI